MDGKSSRTGENYFKMANSVTLMLDRVCRPMTLNFCIRALCLFIVGISLSCVLNVMLILPELRRKVVHERDLLERLYTTMWWFSPSCGLASALIGLIYPCMDSRLGEPHHLRTEWSNVVRCGAFFIGIIHAVVVSFENLKFQVVCNNMYILLKDLLLCFYFFIPHSQDTGTKRNCHETVMG